MLVCHRIMYLRMFSFLSFCGCYGFKVSEEHTSLCLSPLFQQPRKKFLQEQKKKKLDFFIAFYSLCIDT